MEGMFLQKINFGRSLAWLVRFCAFFGVLLIPNFAFAGDGWEIVDKIDLSPFVPNVLDAFLTVAAGVYEYFVGNGDGIIYLLIWGFLAISVFLYLVAMYFPASWTKFLGMSGGGEMWSGIKGGDIAQKVLKTGIRAIVAATILLQLRPNLITEWFVNPFLEFGALYTHAITESVNHTGPKTNNMKCPQSIIQQEWLSERSCDFLIQPMSDLAATNNKMVKKGFSFLSQGLHGLMTPIPRGGQDFFNVLTGGALIFTFIGCNLFMALLIIQGIFNFGMALILYPFHVLSWVAKSSDKWIDFWPAFEGIVKALKQLLITMIACGFILLINIAVVKALFNWNQSVFVVAAGGTASSNVPSVNVLASNSAPNISTAADFGGHSMVWLSAILTFFLMVYIFNFTRKQLESFAPGQSALYDQVKGDAKASWGIVKNSYTNIKKALGFIKK